jgi:hypothetical protein
MNAAMTKGGSIVRTEYRNAQPTRTKRALMSALFTAGRSVREPTRHLVPGSVGASHSLPGGPSYDHFSAFHRRNLAPPAHEHGQPEYHAGSGSDCDTVPERAVFHHAFVPSPVRRKSYNGPFSWNDWISPVTGPDTAPSPAVAVRVSPSESRMVVPSGSNRYMRNPSLVGMNSMLQSQQ